MAIDNGTQSLMALVCDPLGNLHAEARIAFDPHVAAKPGWAEQDPQLFWKALCCACRQLWHKDANLKKRIAWMALTTQRRTVIPVDAAGNPLRAAIDAAVGLGFYGDFKSAVDAMTRSKEVFEPDPERHRRYDALYRQVYLIMYRRLKPLYAKIKEIVGYPD